MPRQYANKRRGVGAVMRKARKYRSYGLAAFGRRVGRYAYRKVSNMVHTFRKQIDLGFLGDTNTAQHKAFNFTFAQLNENNELAELYDEYKIRKVVLTFEPQFSGTNTALNPPYQNWMRIVHDYNDVLPLTTEADYFEYSDCKSKLCASNRIINTVLYPKVLGQTALASGVATYGGKKAPWLNTDNKTIQHLGLKVLIPTLGLALGTVMFKVRATIMVSMRKSR